MQTYNRLRIQQVTVTACASAQFDQSLQGNLWVAKDPKRFQTRNAVGSESLVDAHAILEEIPCPGSY